MRNSENIDDALYRDLCAFYLRNQNDESVFDVWERGDSRGDSTTPSVASDEYRKFIKSQLVGALGGKENRYLLSLGAGNGIIEAGLVAEGYSVLAVDAMDHAVAIMRAKGVPAVVGDVRTWEPPRIGWHVVYADGLLGHLAGEAGANSDFLAKWRSWMAPNDSTLVISNDAPRDGYLRQASPSVAGFEWLAAEYIEDRVQQAGFSHVRSTEFRYERPVTGGRTRVIVTCRA